MSKTRVKAGVMVAAMFCTSLARAEDGAESVTVKLSGGSTAVGVGANWGDGILTFEGYQYPFSVRGLTIGDVGAHGFTGSGSVHNLKRPEDFSGNYTGLGGGLTVDRKSRRLNSSHQIISYAVFCLKKKTTNE